MRLLFCQTSPGQGEVEIRGREVGVEKPGYTNSLSKNLERVFG